MSHEYIVYCFKNMDDESVEFVVSFISLYLRYTDENIHPKFIENVIEMFLEKLYMLSMSFD